MVLPPPSTSHAWTPGAYAGQAGKSHFVRIRTWTTLQADAGKVPQAPEAPVRPGLSCSSCVSTQWAVLGHSFPQSLSDGSQLAQLGRGPSKACRQGGEAPVRSHGDHHAGMQGHQTGPRMVRADGQWARQEAELSEERGQLAAAQSPWRPVIGGDRLPRQRTSLDNPQLQLSGGDRP